MAAIDARATSAWTTSARVGLSSDGLSLVWSPPFDRKVERPADDKTLATSFIRLAASTDWRQFRDFAQEFGPLHLCNHGLPRTHIDVRRTEFFPPEVVDDHFIPSSWGRRAISEPLAVWVSLAQQAHALAYIADVLSDGDTAESSSWQPLVPLLPSIEHVDGRPFNPGRERLDTQKRALAHCMQLWLEWGGVGLAFTWGADDKRPTTRNGARTLFGAIVLGLALRLSAGGDVRVCAGCGVEFTRARRPDPNRRAWCRECGGQRRKALDARDRRARERAERASESEAVR